MTTPNERHPWPPDGFGNADALADIYNVAYARSRASGSSPTDAHQSACEEIHKLGWHSGNHVGRYQRKIKSNERREQK